MLEETILLKERPCLPLFPQDPLFLAFSPSIYRHTHTLVHGMPVSQSLARFAGWWSVVQKIGYFKSSELRVKASEEWKEGEIWKG